MGKVAGEDGQQLPDSHVVSVTSEESSDAQIRCSCSRIRRCLSLKCIFVLILSVAGFLSSVFWLPPLFKLGGRHDPDLDSRLVGHDIVASFYVEKTESQLRDNILQLEDDIFDEMNAPTIRVVVLYLEQVPGSNTSKVVFAVDHDADASEISMATQSLVRASFEFIMIHQISLRLTSSLFGSPFSFEVLKFVGGITVIPPQNVFPLQKVQISFNFTLKNSIEQIQASFYQLKNQLNSGLQLSPYENLNIRLSNIKGSTVDPPAIVQCSVLLAVGIKPSMPRQKQLAQTISDSHSGNLGLNNTVFGKVKQVRLTSFSPSSLNSTASPAPSPLPQTHHHHHHHHHHHKHHHYSAAHLPPSMPPLPPLPPSHGKAASAPQPSSLLIPSIHSKAPSPSWKVISPSPQDSSHTRGKQNSPAPSPDYKANPPCPFGRKRSFAGKAPEGSPTVPPSTLAPNYSAAPQNLQPAPAPRSVSAPNPSPNAAFGRVQPSSSKSNPEFNSNSNSAPSPSSLPFSSSASALVSIERWTVLLLLLLTLHLLR